MKTKTTEKEQARLLRSQGHSIPEISRLLSVSKSSVSVWVRDIEISAKQKSALMWRSHLPAVAGTRAKRVARYEGYSREADAEFVSLQYDPAFMFGLALYIGEGCKKNPNGLTMVNCSGSVIASSIRFYLQIGIPIEKITISFHLHEGGDLQSAVDYWHRVTGICETKIRVVWATSKSSRKTKGNIQPYGCCHLMAWVTPMKQKVLRWMELALEENCMSGSRSAV